MLYAVVTYANMRRVRAVDRIVELCERDLAFIWLTKGQKPKWDAFYDFKSKKLTGEVLDELNDQFLRRLKREGLITLKELFIDGTKIEANANRKTCAYKEDISKYYNMTTRFFEDEHYYLCHDGRELRYSRTEKQGAGRIYPDLGSLWMYRLQRM